MLLVGLSVSAISAIAIPSRSTYGAQVSVDEPQYLLTAMSIANDFNLDISDEIEEKKFLSFHEVALNTQTIDMNDSGQRLSPHDPLLPLLLALPMKIGGWVGARLFLSALAGILASTALWVAVRRFKVSIKTASWTIGVFSAAPPLSSYGSQIYPELPAALAVICAISTATGRTSKVNSIGFAVSITALPWLSIKYLPVAFAIFLLFVLNKKNWESKILFYATLIILFLMSFFYLLFHHRVYGSWTVYAAGDHFVGNEFEVLGGNPDIWGRSKRLTGLLIDRGFGIIAWTPAFLFLPLSFGFLSKKRIENWSYLILPFVMGWAVATWAAFTMHGWWWPGRQIVIILPLGVIAVAIFVDTFKKLLYPLIISALIGTAGWVYLAIESQTGRRALIVDFEETLWPWYKVWSKIFPDLRRMPSNTMWLSSFWSVLVVVLFIAGWALASRNKDSLTSERTYTDMTAGNLNGHSSIR